MPVSFTAVLNYLSKQQAGGFDLCYNLVISKDGGGRYYEWNDGENIVAYLLYAHTSNAALCEAYCPAIWNEVVQTSCIADFDQCEKPLDDIITGGVAYKCFFMQFDDTKFEECIE